MLHHSHNPIHLQYKQNGKQKGLDQYAHKDIIFKPPFKENVPATKSLSNNTVKLYIYTAKLWDFFTKFITQ